MLRVGMLTSGGDCQALNAAMRGMAKTLYNLKGDDVEIYGIFEGYKGLIYGNYRLMEPRDFSGILTEGGTILRTSRTPFKTIDKPTEDGLDKVEAMISNYKKMNLDCLVVLGGNGSHKTANLLSEKGLNVITLPKTIDNDLCETDVSFGFWSAVDVATNTIDTIHSTAASHSRVFIVEVMGHKVGYITLYAGIAGGADIILIPEIDYDVEKVIKTIKAREEEGKSFTIIAIAEGAVSLEERKLEKKELKKLMADKSAAQRLRDELLQHGDYEVREVIPGHMQRGGSPNAYDRVFASRVGAYGAKLILDKQFGYMVAMKDGKLAKVPLKDVAGKIKQVPTDSEIIRDAKALSICFGD
ncbi:MAG: 6-phosphofructokinase [Lachnospiraceae bacterium]